MKQIRHLISASDYILEHEHFLEEGATRNADRAIQSIFNYAHFLKTPLTLSMFVPATDEGVILKEPKKPHTYASENSEHYQRVYNLELYAYNQAKENVLFEGFVDKSYRHDLYVCYGNTWIRFCPINLELKIVNEQTGDEMYFTDAVDCSEKIEDLMLFIPDILKLTPAALKMIYNY